MKQEITKSPFKAPQREEDRWVDVHNDALMVELGIRNPNVVPRDKSVWTKTPYEKRLLKTLRHSCKGDMRFHSVPRKSIPVWARLIIQLKKNRKFPNTTYSTECWQHEIGDVLMRYSYKNKRTGEVVNLVEKYVYNGKVYKPGERPFWP